jgi:hypothetical protein
MIGKTLGSSEHCQYLLFGVGGPALFCLALNRNGGRGGNFLQQCEELEETP